MDNRMLFLLSKGVSHTGTKLFTFSLSWYILSETGSGLNFSLSLLVNYLPAIIMSALAGYISDRTSQPNRLLILCDLASAAVCVLPLLHMGLASVYTVIFLLSMISAIFNNTIDTHLTRLEGINGGEDLKKLTSMAQFITSGVNIAAPSLGGFLIKTLPIQMFAVINIVSFLLSAFGEVFLRYRPRPVQEKAAQGTDPGSILAYIFRDKKLRTFMIGDSLGNFCFSAGFNVAFPLIVTVTLGISSSGYGLITSSTAVGSVLCALARTKRPGRAEFQYPYTKTGGLGALMLLLALIARLPYHPVWTAAVLCAINFSVGWLAVDINIQTKTTMQIYVDSRYLGKILGFSTSISYILIPLSLAFGGTALEIWPSYLLPAGAGALLLAALGLLRLWELGGVHTNC